MVRLKQLRINKGLTQAEMAKLFDITTTQYQRYESGKSCPHVEDLIRLADFFEVSIDYLLDHDIALHSNEPRFEFQKCFNQLNDHEKRIIINIMKEIISEDMFNSTDLTMIGKEKDLNQQKNSK